MHRHHHHHHTIPHGGAAQQQQQQQQQLPPPPYQPDQQQESGVINSQAHHAPPHHHLVNASPPATGGAHHLEQQVLQQAFHSSPTAVQQGPPHPGYAAMFQTAQGGQPSVVGAAPQHFHQQQQGQQVILSPTNTTGNELFPVQTAQGLIYVPQTAIVQQQQQQQPMMASFATPQPPQHVLYNVTSAAVVQQQQGHQQQLQPQQRARTPTPPAAPGDSEPGPRQLIVNYLPPDMADSELQSLFAQHGEIEAARVIYDKATGLTKGFGFVYFVRHVHARAAVASFNGLPLRGKHLKVGYANPQRPISSLSPSPVLGQHPASHAATPASTTPSAIGHGGAAPPSVTVGSPNSRMVADQRRRSSGASAVSLVSPHARSAPNAPPAVQQQPPPLPPPAAGAIKFRRVRLGSDAASMQPPSAPNAAAAPADIAAEHRGRLASDASNMFITPSAHVAGDSFAGHGQAMMDLVGAAGAPLQLSFGLPLQQHQQQQQGSAARRDSVGTVLSTGSWDDVIAAQSINNNNDNTTKSGDADAAFDPEELLRAVRRASEATELDVAAFAATTTAAAPDLKMEQ